MKKITFITIAFLSILSCKEKKTESTTEAADNTVEAVQVPAQTHAEISIKEGGQWNGRKYEGGTHYKSLQELQVPASHTDHSFFIRYEGPGWENSQIGYRIYLDWRNAIDIFGKKVDSIVLPYVGQDNFDSYHENAAWGQDILKAGKSMGIGGYGRIVSDTVVHFQTVKNTLAKIDNSESSSSINIAYEGWQSGSDTINLDAKLTIYPQDRFTKAELSPSKAVSGICTGIVKHKSTSLVKKEGKTWTYIATYGVQTLAGENDKLGMAVFYKNEEVAEQKEGIDDHLVIFKASEKTLTYYFLAAWDQELNGIKDETSFIKDLDKKLETLEKTGTIN